MTTKFRAAAATALVLLIAGVAVASAASSTGNRSSRSDERESVFRLIGRSVDSAWLDLGAPGDSLGDQLHFTSDLIQPPRSGVGPPPPGAGPPTETKIGQDGGLCHLVRIAPDGATTFHCVGTNSLPLGQITAQGMVTYAPGEEFRRKPYSFAITGGTGKYRAARGEIRIQEVSAEEVRLKFRVIL